MKHRADTVMDNYEKNVFRPDEREHGSAFKRCCDSCINVPCKVLNRIPCLAQEKIENTCEENGCTDIENCDEICQHSRIYTPAQMGEKIKAERERVLQKINDVLYAMEENGEEMSYENIMHELESWRSENP